MAISQNSPGALRIEVMMPMRMISMSNAPMRIQKPARGAEVSTRTDGAGAGVGAGVAVGAADASGAAAASAAGAVAVATGAAAAATRARLADRSLIDNRIV